MSSPDSLAPIRLPLGLVNAYLLPGRHGDVLVDAGMPGSGGRLLRLLARHSSTPRRLALVVVTHVHFDHVGSLAAVRALSGAPVLVHRWEAPLLAAGRAVLPAGQTVLARALMALAAPLARRQRLAPCPPDILVDDELSLAAYGVGARVLHTPGHTRGSLTVLLDGGHAVVGDLCQNGWVFGMGMGPVLPPLADAPEAVAGSYERLLAAGVRQVHPGHGTPFPADRLLAALPAWQRRQAAARNAPGGRP